jgi:lactoylglutathione lyase
VAQAGGVLTSRSSRTRLDLERNTMSAQSVSLGYVILYVSDVSASLDFYERAFGLSRRFFHEEEGKAYGELETGATRLAFASVEMASEHVGREVVAASLGTAPLGVEIALVTADVPAAFARAIEAGGTPLSEPAVKPWGQTVAYLRDNAGHLVEVCSPLP